MLELKDILKKDVAWKAYQNRELITIDDLLVSKQFLNIPVTTTICWIERR